nr:LETM1 domain-containing protein 1-like [Cherax quadricarinatus]
MSQLSGSFDLKCLDFIKLLVQLSLPGCTLCTLSRRELELYYYMPGDMFRVFPVLLISSLPFGQNIAFPIGYWFPRYLLSRHFWDIQQRHDFAVLALKERLYNARPVFRSLQAVLYTINDHKYQEKCRTAFYKLGSGIHPTTNEIVSLLPLFQDDPFHISRISSTHVNGLLRLHGRSVWGRRRNRLKDHAHILHCIDAALSREGFDSLNHDQLKSCLFLRGLNPTNMSTVAMMEFLESWLQVSQVVDASSYSLLLHLPILLTYNQPSNIVLIY